MNLVERYQKPTPKFFRVLRNIGIAMATTGGSIIAAPIALPAVVVTVATYLTVAGTVATAISQAVVADEGLSTSSRQRKEAKQNELRDHLKRKLEQENQ